MDPEISRVLSFMKAKGCHVNATWLTDCVNFFRSENQQCNLKSLEAFAYDQWLLADLRDMGGVASFPPNLANQLSISLNGRMACQVEYLTDIGHSSYTQIQKMRNEDIGNLEIKDDNKEFQQAWEPKTNRMLNLSICDGVQTIRAIEYKPIPKLNTNLIPGTKLLIVGPVQCRRGVLLLEDKHLVILGGEVDALIISNAYENILARKLQLPENPDPYKSANRVEQANTPPSSPLRQAALPIPLAETARALAAPQLPPQQPSGIPQRQPPSRQLQPPAQRQQLPVRQPKASARQQPQMATSRAHVPQSSSAYSVSNSSHQQKKLIQPTLSWGKPTVNAVSQSKSANQQEQQMKSNYPMTENIMDVNSGDWEEEGDIEQEMANLEESDYNNRVAPNIQHPTKTLRNESNTTFQNEFEMGSDDEDLLLIAEANILKPKSNEISKDMEHAMRPAHDSSPHTATLSKKLDESCAVKRQASDDIQQIHKKPLFLKQSRQETSSQEVTSTSDVRNSLEMFATDWLDDDEGTFLDATANVASKKEIPKRVESIPYVYLSQIRNLKGKSNDQFRVKAVVVTVVDKLKITNDDKWELSVIVTDGSANMDVRFSSKVLDEMIGMSASEMQSLKRVMKEQPSKKEYVRKKLEQAQKQLISLNCFMDIKMSFGNDVVPTVVGLEKLSSFAVSALKARQLHSS